jgi:hypothetical protein
LCEIFLKELFLFGPQILAANPPSAKRCYWVVGASVDRSVTATIHQPVQFTIKGQSCFLVN